jgi:hypothetical protein
VESFKKDEIICTLSQEVYRNKELSTEFLKNPELDKEAHDKLQQIIERSLDKQFKKQELINCFNEKQPKRPSLDDASREIITKKLEATIDMCHDKIQGFSKEQLDKFYENATKAALTSIDKKTTYSLNRTGIKISPTVLTTFSVDKTKLQSSMDKVLISISSSGGVPKLGTVTHNIRGNNGVQR